MNLSQFFIIKKAYTSQNEQDIADNTDAAGRAYTQSMRSDISGLPVPGYGYFAEDCPNVEHQNNCNYTGGLPLASNNNKTAVTAPYTNGAGQRVVGANTSWNWTKPANGMGKDFVQFYNRMPTDKWQSGPYAGMYKAPYADQWGGFFNRAQNKFMTTLHPNRPNGNQVASTPDSFGF